MPNATFDTLKFARTLRDAGVPAAQAEAEAGVLAEVFSINFRDVVTKDDLGHAVTNVETKIRETEQRLNVKIEGAKVELAAKIEAVKTDLREVEQRTTAKTDGVRIDLTAKIEALQSELFAKFEAGRNDLRETEQRLISKIDHLAINFTYLKWIAGVGLSLIAGVASPCCFSL